MTLLTAGIFTACAGEQEKVEVEPVKSEIVHEEDGKDTASDTEGGEQMSALPEDNGNHAEEDIENSAAGDAEGTSGAAEALKKQFGENCITEQTFEVELSEYDGKVYVVPYEPSGDGQDFHMQIVRDGEILTKINGYVPETLQGQRFVSLDAVSFFDVNFDGNTDIVLIETYGSTSFAAVYYGDVSGEDERDCYFLSRDRLSENLSETLSVVSISEMRTLLTGGKKNGEFSGYQEAYEAVVRLCGLEYSGEADTNKMGYDLIDFDGDDIPELAAGVDGYFVSLYTYCDGRVYTLMDHWSYGAMGNSGYAYSPGKNSLRNYNTDYAGAILYTTYMEVGEEHSLVQTGQIVTYNFDDVNGNGMPDENEQDSIGNYGVNYIDGREAAEEECMAYDVGEYEYIRGKMSADSLLAELKQ